MRGELMVALMVFSLSVIAQKTSSIELSYDFTPTKLTHYNLSKPGEFEQKYKQPYYYVSTLKFNQAFNRSTVGFGVRGFWLNGNEKSIGAQLDYYRDYQLSSPIILSFGVNTIWDSYRFKDNQERVKINIKQQSLKLLPNIKVTHSIKSSSWHIKAMLGLGLGIGSTEYIEARQWSYNDAVVHSEGLMDEPYIVFGTGIGLVRHF